MRASLIILVVAIAGIIFVNSPFLEAQSHETSQDVLSANNPNKLNELGPMVGAMLPHPLFDVNEAGGCDAISGENGLVLFFVRSLDWCPFCKRQATQANDRIAEFEQRGFNIAFVSYDDSQKQQRFTEATGFKGYTLSDTDIEIINAFGLRNEQHKPESRAYGIPYPAVFIVNSDKTIAAKLYEEDYVTNKKSYRNRPAVDIILEKIDGSR